MLENEEHPYACQCGCQEPEDSQAGKVMGSRRGFIKTIGTLGLGLSGAPLMANVSPTDEKHLQSMEHSRAVEKGKAQIATILHTSDIHAQLLTHDEFFFENGKVVYKKRGGFAVLKTMLHHLRAQNPENTILIDGGDCFQGGGVAALTKGAAIVPLVNDIGYDLMLPGNWEVVYGKEMMWKDLGGYHADKLCANMFHDTQDGFRDELIFPPYWTRMVAGIKIGFIGYNDPLTPKRQSPAYSYGIRFAKPEVNVARYIKILREYELCSMVFLVTHMGLAQQIDLANQAYVEGVDFVMGADTHERVRKPIQAKYSKVTEPGAFGSFVAKFDIVVEDGQVKDTHYQLLDVDPVKYPADAAMASLVKKTRAPFKAELDKVIGKTKTTLVRYYVIENPMDNMITDALMWKFKPDIALSNGFRFCPPLVPDAKTGMADITNDFLWSMLPVDSEAKQGEVSGQQLWDWLEKELHNVFAKDPAKRFGGWLIRFQGMQINFTIHKDMGERVNWVKIKGEMLDKSKTYSVLACEREGDPDDTLCRIEKVKNAKRVGATLHDIMREYLAAHSPVAPVIEGRATATDAESTLLSQVEGYDYQFR